MYQPAFNSVLVQIEDKEAKWSPGNDESMLGKSFSKGTLIEIAKLVPNNKYPDEDVLENIGEYLNELKGKQIIWNEGAEAGTTFEHDNKLYGFIYWNDIRGVLTDA